MKRTYLAKRNALLSSTNISWGAYALIVAVLLLILRISAPNFFWTVFTPVFRASDAFSEKSSLFFNSFGDTAKLSVQNERLIEENSALFLQNQTLIQKIEDISGLEQDGKTIIAGVVARPPSSPYDTLILAGGSNEGIILGMEAFGEGGTPLGVVSTVLDDFSRVTLFSAPKMTVSGWVGKNSLPVTIIGVGAGAMQASVARSAGIVVGDVVSVPGPGRISIGSVVRVDSDPSSPSVTLRIRSELNMFSVAWVTLRDTGISIP